MPSDERLHGSASPEDAESMLRAPKDAVASEL